MTPRPVSPSVVYRAALRASRGGRRQAGRLVLVSHGISRASNVDPLFPDEPSGAEATAAILLAIGSMASGLDPFSREGPFLGLYRMRPPMSPPVRPGAFYLPEPASLYAIDLARLSFDALRARPLAERLALFREVGRRDGPLVPTRAPSGVALSWSRDVVARAQALFPAISSPRAHDRAEPFPSAATTTRAAAPRALSAGEVRA